MRDSNPRYVAVYLISSQAPSTTRPTLRELRIIPVSDASPAVLPRAAIRGFLPHSLNKKRNGAAAPFRIVHRERNETFRYFFAGADTAAGVPFPFGAAAIDAGCICAAGTALPLAFMSAK